MFKYYTIQYTVCTTVILKCHFHLHKNYLIYTYLFVNLHKILFLSWGKPIEISGIQLCLTYKISYFYVIQCTTYKSIYNCS